jgi:SAM-dependent methyltransferase
MARTVKFPRTLTALFTLIVSITPGGARAANILRGLLQRHGPDAIKEGLWDYEFSSGRWDCLDDMRGDCVYQHVERHARGGSILDLGCGPGATGAELARHSYSSYTGVDISKIAVERAIARAQREGRGDTNRYFQGDIAAYVPDRKHDLMLFGDSLYYIPWNAIPDTLERYAEHLTLTGVFIARIYGTRFYTIMDAIENRFEVIERHTYPAGGDHIFVLVFRKAPQPQVDTAASSRLS